MLGRFVQEQRGRCRRRCVCRRAVLYVPEHYVPAPWQTLGPFQRLRQLGMDVLEELETYKIPALRQAKARLTKDLSIILFSKSGFARRLVEAAEERDDLSLVGVDQLVGDLIGS